ncbi:MAG: FAD-binding protein [Clostridia bacterium]
MCNGTLAQTDGMMFSIYDQRSAVADIDQYIEMGEVFCGKTLAELAEKIGVDTLGLEATVANYNEMVIAGKDTEQNKKQIGLTIEEGPFYGVPYAPSVHHTMGGVKIDVEARVLNKANQWIEGLFACGEVTGGIHGSNRVGANALPDCVVYGRIAGANAIK